MSQKYTCFIADGAVHEERLARLEFACGISWLLTDATWFLEWRSGNYIAGITAITLALTMFNYIERAWVPILVHTSALMWIVMNVAWAISDMAEPKSELLHTVALYALWGCFGCLGFIVWITRRQTLAEVAKQVHILRIFRKW